MKIIQTGFEGLILIEPKVYPDERGFFYETWQDERYEAAGIREKFLQDNVSFCKKNVLKGLHSQKDQGQLVYVTYGKIFDVAVDLRPSSPTFKKYFSVELCGEDPKQLYMAPGFAHGLYVLSDFAIVTYKATQRYNPSQEKNIVWDDPEIDILWPNGDKIISEKDKDSHRMSL